MLKAIQDSLFQLSLRSTILLAVSGFLVLLCYTRVWTTVAYRRAVTTIEDDSKGGVVPSPMIPYSIPWLGHTLRFFTKNPNRWYHRQSFQPPHGVYSMIIGGRRTHVVTSPAATRHLFINAYSRGLTRETFVKDLLLKCLLVLPRDTSAINTGEGRRQQEDVFHKYLARREVVAELTSVFSDLLAQSNERVFDQSDTLENTPLYGWLRNRIFSASLGVFFGKELEKLYPGICDDVFNFDKNLTMFFFEFPRFLNSNAWNCREHLLENLVRWDAHIQKTGKGAPRDPAVSDSWDPIFGSRFHKARMRLFDELNLSMQSRAGMNLSIMFALASNVVPAVAWVMYHLLAGPDSHHLLQTVQEEVNMAMNPDGTLDIPAILSATPLLQSMFTEVLRYYCDNMIMREIVEDTTIPLDDQGLRWFAAKKGSMAISPCWVPHHDAANWKYDEFEQPPDVYVADRFVGEHLDRMKVNALAGVHTTKMYPFGGGKPICPGRVSRGARNMLLFKS